MLVVDSSVVVVTEDSVTVWNEVENWVENKVAVEVVVPTTVDNRVDVTVEGDAELLDETEM